METSDYFKIPDKTKKLLRGVFERTDEEKAEVGARMHKVRSRHKSDPKQSLTSEIILLEDKIERIKGGKNIKLLDAIPQLQSQLKRMKAELAALEN